MTSRESGSIRENSGKSTFEAAAKMKEIKLDGN
jgi:hypothetical protein